MEHTQSIPVRDLATRQVQRLNTRGWSRRLFVAYCAAMVVAYVVLIPTTARPGFSIWGPGDFTIFYTAGHMIRDGIAHRLYDLDLQAQVQQTLLSPYGWAYRDGLLPYNYLPFVAIPFIPLSLLPLEWAFSLWNVLNILLALLSVKLLLNHLRRHSIREFLIAAGVTFAFFPVFQALINGQTSFVVLFALTVAYLSLKNEREYLAGLALALGLIKPQLIILPIAMLIYHRRSRTVFAFAATSLALLASSWLMVGYDGLAAYVDVIRQMSNWHGIYGFEPTLMANLRGVTYRLGELSSTLFHLQVPASISQVFTVLLSAAILVLVLRTWQGPWRPDQPAFDLQFSQTITAGLLISPHLYGHDLAVLILVGFLAFNFFHEAGPRILGNGIIGSGHVLPVLTLAAFGLKWQSQCMMLFMVGLVIISFRAVRRPQERVSV